MWRQEVHMARTSAEAKWSALIDVFERSGLTAADFCQQRTLNPQTFAWYRSRLRKQRQNTLPVPIVPAFVEVTLPRSAESVRLRFDHRPFCLEFPPGVDLAWVRAVVGALC